MRAASDRILVCAKSGCFGDSRRNRLHQTPNAKRCMFLSFPTSVRLFDALITDYRIVITDYWLNAAATGDAPPDVY